MNHIHIPYLSAPPGLTSDLSVGAWAVVPWHGHFTKIGPSHPTPTPSTLLAMAHDGLHLFLGVRCLAIEGSSAEQLAKEEVQVMLNSECSGQRAGLLITHADGKVLAKTVFETSSTDLWTGEVGSAVRVNRDEWSLALKVPLSQLRHEDGPLRRMRFNVVRLPTRTQPETWLSFAPLTEESFWLPGHATAEAEFDRPDLLTAFAWTVERVGRARFRDSAGIASCSQAIKVVNRSTENREVELRATFTEPGTPSSNEARLRLRFGPGESRVEGVELSVPGASQFGFVRVALHESGSGQCLCPRQPGSTPYT